MSFTACPAPLRSISEALTPRRHSPAHSQKGNQHMADYFTNFSLIVPLPSDEAVDYALNQHHAAADSHLNGACHEAVRH